MSTQNEPIEIRLLSSVEECRHFQRVEQIIWGSDDESLVPTHVLLTLVHNGGLVAAAFAADGPAETGGMVGIVMGWLGHATPPGEQQERIKFCSHMAGVLPPWQRRRVGLQLKLAQRDWVIAQGVTDWVTWTFDPLFRANGVFNIHRLGATCRTYIRDLYGEMTDALNAGMPSDRCQVDWWLRSERVEQAVARAHAETQAAAARLPGHYPELQRLATLPSGDFRRPIGEPAHWDGRPVAVPLPEDIAAIRREDRSLALEWRHFVRARLEEGFQAGYSVVDCMHEAGRDWAYVLTPA